ncbi:MAG: hypothetical protein IPQ24_10045 [Anaeromyxobacter sp.]|nr:hypothetical protein [Anaeromyxobacter sp.]
MRALAALLLLAVGGPAGAAPGALQLFPVRGVYLARAAGEGRPDLIDPDFRAALGEVERAYFAERFRTRFPGAAATMDEKNARRTFAVSLQVARASKYLAAKVNGTWDLLLPVTGSIYFTNVGTGEVLYASTRTIITTASIGSEDTVPGAPRVVALFAETFRKVADDLVEGAAARFAPVTVSARVRGVWHGLAILDAGADDGLAETDQFSNEDGDDLEVISVAPRHAVARPLVRPPSVGAVVHKVLNGTLADVKKPRVLALVDEAPPGFPDEALVQLFADALGAAAPVSLVPVNRSFAEVIKTLTSTTGLSQERLRQRQVPEFFVRLHVPPPVSFERPTNLEYKQLRVTEALAFAELVDATGRILFTAVGRDRLEDEITGGMALPLPARLEVAVKNSLLDLARQFGRLRMGRSDLALGGAGSDLTVVDPGGVLAEGKPARAFRSIGAVDGISGEVLVPIWQLQVVEVADGVAHLAPGIELVPGVGPPRAGDRLLLDGVDARRVTRRRIGSCGAADQLGAVQVARFEDLALGLFAASYAAPVYSRGLGEAIGSLVRAGSGFKDDLRVSEPPLDLCLQAVTKIDPGAATCDEQACADVTALLVGYRLRAPGGGEVQAKTGMGTRITGRSLPVGTPAPARAAARQADVMDELLKVTPAAAAAFSQQTL